MQGPRTPALVNMVRFGLDTAGYLPRMHERYGDVFAVRFPAFGRCVYLCEPSLVKELFTGSPRDLHAGEANATVLEPALGPSSVLTLDEDEHMRQRKLLLAPFHGRALDHYRETMLEAARRDLETWPIGTPFPARERMQRITLEVILRAVYGLEADDQSGHDVIAEFTAASDAIMLPPLLRRGRFGPWGRFVRARQALDDLVYDVIAQRRAAGDWEERDDVLSLLLRTDPTDQELRDELVTVVGAGHETTATALAWALERLTRHPEVLAKLRASLDEGDDYLDAVIRETLRVRPVIVDVARRATRDLTIGGHHVPEGTLVMAAITALHAREDLYPDARAFRPERFLEDAPDTYSWIPFGGGVRRCLGAAFAHEEMRIVLREVVSRADLRVTAEPGEKARTRNITTAPRHGGLVVCDGLAARPARPLAAAAAP